MVKLEKIGMMYTEQYKRQSYHAYRRNIPFTLTYEEWVEFWGADITQRGRGLGKLQMCRNEDKGAYALGNIYKATCEQNSSDKFKFGFKGRASAISQSEEWFITGLLENGYSTRTVALLVNCDQKQIMNFKNQKGAYAKH